MKMRTFVLAGALFVGLSNMAGVAMAQTKVYIVNENKIRAESKLGKALDDQMVQVGNAGVDQLGLKSLQSEVKTEGEALKPQVQSLSKEALAANPTLKGRVDAYNKKMSELAQKSNLLDQRMEQQRTANQIAFEYVLVPAVETVGKEVGADVVLSYSAALYNKDAIDISAKVIARLDATVPTLEALKAALPQPPANATAPKPAGQ
jgi:Skp family chaperone for outer membrane proteins